jgi:hypothetical protein
MSKFSDEILVSYVEQNPRLEGKSFTAVFYIDGTYKYLHWTYTDRSYWRLQHDKLEYSRQVELDRWHTWEKSEEIYRLLDAELALRKIIET